MKATFVTNENAPPEDGDLGLGEPFGFLRSTPGGKTPNPRPTSCHGSCPGEKGRHP